MLIAERATLKHHGCVAYCMLKRRSIFVMMVSKISSQHSSSPNGYDGKVLVWAEAAADDGGPQNDPLREVDR